MKITKNILRESIRQVLNENARDKRVLDFLKSKGYEDYNERMKIISTIHHDVPSLKFDKDKFLLGVCRYVTDRQLSDALSIFHINDILNYIHCAGHTDDFDENLNGKSVNELYEMFREPIKQMIEKDKLRSASQQFNGGSQYRIIPINSYEEAKPYGKYTPWCITQAKSHFDGYTKYGERFYFCLKDGFKNVPKDDDGAPLNEYGLSMISVLVKPDGNLFVTTTRYNHDFNGENNPELHTAEQLEKVLNVPFYQTFKPYTREELHARGIILFDEVQGLLDAGTPPEKIFQNVGRFSEGFARVELNGKYNFIDKNGKLLSGTWFDSAWNFSEGFTYVELNGKYNFIDKNGKSLSDTWFDDAGIFSEGSAWVKLNTKWNLIDKNGKLLSNTWFDDVIDFSEGFTYVELNGKYNFIDKNGKLLSGTWFDSADNFSEGFARVELNGKWNFIDKNGKLLYGTWFDYAWNFSKGFARVKLGEKWKCLGRDGNVCDSIVSENLRKVVRQTICEALKARKSNKKTLTEKLSDVPLYHFTTIGAFTEMCRTGDIIFSKANSEWDKTYSTEHGWYLSLTRNPNFERGYPGSVNREDKVGLDRYMCVRIEFDSKKLESAFASKNDHIDFYDWLKKKNEEGSKTNTGKTKQIQSKMEHPENEEEERIMDNYMYLSAANIYIKSVLIRIPWLTANEKSLLKGRMFAPKVNWINGSYITQINFARKLKFILGSESQISQSKIKFQSVLGEPIYNINSSIKFWLGKEIGGSTASAEKANIERNKSIDRKGDTSWDEIPARLLEDVAQWIATYYFHAIGSKVVQGNEKSEEWELKEREKFLRTINEDSLFGWLKHCNFTEEGENRGNSLDYFNGTLVKLMDSRFALKDPDAKMFNLRKKMTGSKRHLCTGCEVFKDRIQKSFK